jgi:hypothetical protein
MVSWVEHSQVDIEGLLKAKDEPFAKGLVKAAVLDAVNSRRLLRPTCSLDDWSFYVRLDRGSRDRVIEYCKVELQEWPLCSALVSQLTDSGSGVSLAAVYSLAGFQGFSGGAASGPNGGGGSSSDGGGGSGSGGASGGGGGGGGGGRGSDGGGSDYRGSNNRGSNNRDSDYCDSEGGGGGGSMSQSRSGVQPLVSVPCQQLPWQLLSGVSCSPCSLMTSFCGGCVSPLAGYFGASGRRSSSLCHDGTDHCTAILLPGHGASLYTCMVPCCHHSHVSHWQRGRTPGEVQRAHGHV